MAVLKVRKYGDPALRRRGAEVGEITSALRETIADMIETMYDEVGIGLAAPQVGQSSRVIVLDVAREGEKPQPLRLANPEILWRSPEFATFSEGCLSLPEHYADVTRPAEVRVRYLDQENEIREMHAEGLLATCLQHEIEHLDGILFVDHLSLVKRGMILRKLAKAKRSQALATA